MSFVLVRRWKGPGVCVCLTLCRCICFRLQEPWVIPGAQMKTCCLRPEQDMLYIKLVLTNMSYRAPEILAKGGACFMVDCSRNVSRGAGLAACPRVSPEWWHVLAVWLTTPSMSNTSRLNLHPEVCAVHVQCLCIDAYNGADFIQMIEYSLTTLVRSGLSEAMFVRLNSTRHSNTEGQRS